MLFARKKAAGTFDVKNLSLPVSAITDINVNFYFETFLSSLLISTGPFGLSIVTFFPLELTLTP